MEYLLTTCPAIICISKSYCLLIILFVFTVSVEKIDLKGLSHTKNDRSVECSFEVRCCFFPRLGGIEGYICHK